MIPLLTLFLAGSPAVVRTSAPDDFSVTLAADSSATILLSGQSTITAYVDIPGSATVAITCSADGTHFDACSLRGLVSDIFSSSLTSDQTVLGSVAGMRAVRFTATGGTGSGSITGRLTAPVSTLEGIEHGSPDDFQFLVSSGHQSALQPANKFGKNVDIDTGAAEDIWSYGGSYTFSSTAETWYLMSSSSSDTGALVCNLLDGSYVESTVTTTLTGQTPVALTGSWLRVNRCYNDSSALLVGTVYLSRSSSATAGVPNTATDVRATIDLGYDQTRQVVYTVPDGYELYVYHWGGTISGGGNVALELLVRSPGKAWRSRGELQIANNSGFAREYFAPLVFDEHSDVRLRGQSSANNTVVQGFFDGLLEAQ